jgi:Phage integrase family
MGCRLLREGNEGESSVNAVDNPFSNTSQIVEGGRSLPIGDLLASALTDGLRVSQHIGPEEFVFCKPDGCPLHPDVVRKDVLYPVLDRLGIARTTRGSGFHAFRHAVASLINERTGDIKLAQKLLGHTNPTMTANVYTHTYLIGARIARLAGLQRDALRARELLQALLGFGFACCRGLCHVAYFEADRGWRKTVDFRQLAKRTRPTNNERPNTMSVAGSKEGSTNNESSSF